MVLRVDIPKVYGAFVSKSRGKRKRRTSKSKRRSGKKRSTRRSASTGGRCILDPVTLQTLNGLDWDVKTAPESAVYSGQKLSYEGLTRKVCKGSIRLLLPIVNKSPTDALTVLYEVPVGKSGIRIIDVLSTIWRFYNVTPIGTEDVQNLLVLNSRRGYAESLLKDPVKLKGVHFKDMMDNATKFGGLIHQTGNVYAVRLVTNHQK